MSSSPHPLLPSDARGRNCEVAGMRTGTKPNRVRVALRRCAVATMDESRWRELADLISEDAADWVDRP